VSRLPNPINDARAIAATLRRLEFAEVMERYDLTLAGLGDALKTFGDKTADADWAVIYFAGHGVEMNGVAYLIPVDAKLQRDAHVFDETLPLERLLTKVETARKLRLVILDACRNNPFTSRMIRNSATNRSVGRGLAFIEPDAGVLVAYSAKHGTTALDGEGSNSPFAEALLANLEEPGVEVHCSAGSSTRHREADLCRRAGRRGEELACPKPSVRRRAGDSVDPSTQTSRMRTSRSALAARYARQAPQHGAPC
jgi:uncharacterized caspase-like protein